MQETHSEILLPEELSASTQSLTCDEGEEDESKVPLLIESSWSAQGLLQGATEEDTYPGVSFPKDVSSTTQNFDGLNGEETEGLLPEIHMPVYTLLENGRVGIDEAPCPASLDTVRI